MVWQEKNGLWNLAYASSIDIKDTSPPSIYSIRASPNIVVNGTNIAISAVVTDPSSVLEVTAFIQNGDENNYMKIQLFEIGDGTYLNTINTTLLKGLYLVDIKAVDNYNNSIELENRACFGVTNDDTCEGIYQALFNGKNDTIDARSSNDVVLEIHTVSNFTNSSICIARYSSSEYKLSGSISLDKYFEIESEKELSEALDYVIIKIYYTDIELGVLNENKIKIYYLNLTSGNWEALETFISVSENYVWANITHFSIYGVFENIMEIQTDDFVKGNPSEIVIHDFYFKNLGNSDVFNFVLNSSNGWDLNIIGGNNRFISSGETETIQVEVTIPDGADADVEDFLTFNITATNTSAALSITAKTIVNQISKVFIESRTSDQRLIPGQFFLYQFRIINQGNGVDNFTLNATSENNWETYLSKNYVVLESGMNKTVSIKILIPSDTQILADKTDILVLTATSKDFDSSHSNSSTTTIEQLFGVVLRCDNNESNFFNYPNKYFKYSITVYNQGNGKDVFDFYITYKTKRWYTSFSVDSVTLEGYSKINITFIVTPPETEEIGTKAIFNITAISIGSSINYDEITTLSTIPKPELWIEELYYNVDDHVLVGQNLKITATIANSGSVANIFWVRISLNGTSGLKTLIETTIHNLGPGKTEDVSIYWTVENGFEGNIIIEIDYEQKIDESDETNNKLIEKTPVVVEIEMVSSSYESNLIFIMISVVIVTIFSLFRRKKRK